ncbi:MULTISPECIES: helix-turn-helix domain-containing protein [Aerococcus]|uniref:Helix-turn-helix transcriptional regulator n=1 Tax=Aerococcus sanguinicola TaxID=119206 RepID=A0A5N1GPW7_9LACT|nr:MULTISPECIES: helix-turn-helix transcriptional regulator [Aerococcus]KAA9302299.1 helix-turn-helix transcriptional regulator [Aerococcus sanguinicola]MDK6369054.1 helix-turn-helix transcriptional regulator [Aerococcus sp. UMB9870]MDK6678956.1 helix-turn-helix transcriptional regulator [Aerococcus sp. UMB8608]MDK6686547.1 helix-turn-helix transcriptional regulator [Aerococcus sp. UMB8623]MDK6939615.1 helix-turn-helix transcriptional regulator [Aerococcus sp. UMB8487]
MNDFISDKVVAERLKALREEKGYTQKDLANLISANYETVRGWDYGKSLPKHEMLARLAKLYNVSIDYILGQTNTKERYK